MVTKANEHNRLDRFRDKKRLAWWYIPLFIIIAILGWYVASILLAYSNVTAEKTPSDDNPAATIQEVVKADKPINILLIGVGGASHPGGTLADSVMVASLDAKHNTISLLSLPRDMYVTLPNGAKDKLNAAHSYGENAKKGQGPVVLAQTVSNTLGIPIHSYIRIDFDGFKKMVDAVGGITINVKTALNDPLFPDDKMKGYAPFYISAGVHTMNGTTALKYARSRETTSDFDRARRQQEVILAVRDKVLTPQVLANPKKVTDIISIIGTHALTDLSARDMDDLLKIFRNLNNPAVNRKVIDDGDSGLLVSSRAANGAYILIPRGGNYNTIKLFTAAYFAAPSIKDEKPTLLIQNSGASKTTVATLTTQLVNAGFSVKTPESALSTDATTPGTAATATPKLVGQTTKLYDNTQGKKPNSLDFLKNTLDILPSKNASDVTDYDFILVVDSTFTLAVKDTVPTADVSTKTKSTISPQSSPEARLPSKQNSIISESLLESSQKTTTIRN